MKQLSFILLFCFSQVALVCLHINKQAQAVALSYQLQKNSKLKNSLEQKKTDSFKYVANIAKSAAYQTSGATKTSYETY